MQNTPALTKRKWNLNIVTENELTRLRFHIEAKAKKRIEQFWNKNINWLENKFDDFFKVKDPNQFMNGLVRIVTKQVLSMAEYDKAYKVTNGEMITDDNKIEELIEISLYNPELFSSIQSRDKRKLKQLTQKMTTVLAKSKSENKIYKKALEDKQEKDKKMIDNMAESYIDTCESFRTHKPSKPQLSKISGVEERFWKTQLANEAFLNHLLEELNKKRNQANKLKKEKVQKGSLENKFQKSSRKEFWEKAFDWIVNRIDFVTDKDRFKPKYSPNTNVIDGKRFAKSKGKRLSAQEIIRSKQAPIEEAQEEKFCNLCRKPIETGELCKDCYPVE